MSSNINWMDNKVINPGTTRQSNRSTYASPTDNNTGYSAPSSTPQRTAAPPAMPQQSVITPDIPAQQSSVSSDTASQQSAVLPGTPLPFQQGFPPATEKGYIPYYLASNIGKNVRAEFFIGGSQYSDKVGKLIEVGISYFVLEDVNSRTHVMCDLYSVKFVTVLLDSSCVLA